MRLRRLILPLACFLAVTAACDSSNSREPSPLIGSWFSSDEAVRLAIEFADESRISATLFVKTGATQNGREIEESAIITGRLTSSGLIIVIDDAGGAEIEPGPDQILLSVTGITALPGFTADSLALTKSL